MGISKSGYSIIVLAGILLLISFSISLLTYNNRVLELNEKHYITAPYDLEKAREIVIYKDAVYLVVIVATFVQTVREALAADVQYLRYKRRMEEYVFFARDKKEVLTPYCIYCRGVIPSILILLYTIYFM